MHGWTEGLVLDYATQRVAAERLSMGELYRAAADEIERRAHAEKDAARWAHVWQCVRIARHGEYVVTPDDQTGLAEDSIARARFVREVDEALARRGA